MTVYEREMCIAYSDLIQVGELIQHMLRLGVYPMLSDDSKKDLASAELELERVRGEMGRCVSELTDYGGGSVENESVKKERKET